MSGPEWPSYPWSGALIWIKLKLLVSSTRFYRSRAVLYGLNDGFKPNNDQKTFKNHENPSESSSGAENQWKSMEIDEHRWTSMKHDDKMKIKEHYIMFDGFWFFQSHYAMLYYILVYFILFYYIILYYIILYYIIFYFIIVPYIPKVSHI